MMKYIYAFVLVCLIGLSGLLGYRLYDLEDRLMLCEVNAAQDVLTLETVNRYRQEEAEAFHSALAQGERGIQSAHVSTIEQQKEIAQLKAKANRPKSVKK